MALPMRPMGSQGMIASMQGYGCMGLTAFYGKPLSDEAGVAVMQEAYNLGIRHFDTAEIYQGTDGGTQKFNEDLVGQFVAKVGKENVTIATKYFPGGERGTCTAEQVRGALETSLKRLGMDCVDLYYLHRIPNGEDGLTSWMTAASELVKEGKIKYLGLSEATPAEIRRAHAIHPLTAVQQEWSLLVRNLEADVVPTCRELGIGIVAYSPLCRGFTSALVKRTADWSKIGNEGGALEGFQASCPRLSGDNAVANAKLLEPLEEVAKEKGVTPAQLSLAWVHYQGEDVFPIPGTTNIANLQANVQAVAMATWKPVLKGIGESVDYKKVQGERYAPGLHAMSYESK